MVVVNLYKINAMTPAAIAPKNACIGEGVDLDSIGPVLIAFKLSNASSFKDFFTPTDLNF